ncbi:MAG: sugar phosphorylase [Opitutaceae bacterium]|nr:sugar phosphorylase [Opitutaceae bacterium]
MASRIFPLLESLYGPAGAAVLAPKLATLLHRFRSELAARRGPRSSTDLSERDVLLITYADQVRDPEITALAALAHFARHHLRGVVSGIHLLPFYPWSSDDGFAVKDYFAVAQEYGTWNDIDRLGAEFDLMFDAVFNHLSSESDWFRGFLAGDERFRDFFVTVTGEPDLSQVVRPRALPLLTEFAGRGGPQQIWTTFGADQVDLNFRNPEVLAAVLEALLFYVARGARFIRLDAIAFLWKEIGTSCLHRPQTHHLIQLLRAVLDEVAPHVLLVTETNVPHEDNLSYFGDGANEAQLVYNFALPPLVLHSMQTGRAEKLTRWAQTLVLPSDRATFLNFLASHDGVGLNPVRGILAEGEIDALVQRTLDHGGFISYKHLPDGSQVPYEMNINYLDALSNPGAAEPAEMAARRFLTAQAMMLCLPGLPGIYFHSLFGSRGDLRGVEASGIKRRINREKLARANLETELADPASLRARVFGGFRDLLGFRRTHPAFAPNSPQRVLELDPRVFAVLRETVDGRDRVLCLHNVSAGSVTVPTGSLGAGQPFLEAHGWRWIPLA